MTDANGNVYRQYYYDPYGNVIKVLDGSGATVDINNDSGFNNAYTYRGYRYDQESGLYFLNARYYAAGIGRFLTKDLVLGVPTDPGSLNRYAYCEGDPVNFTDPSGYIMIGGHYVDRLFPGENPFDDARGSEPVPPVPIPNAAQPGPRVGATPRIEVTDQVVAIKPDIKQVNDVAKKLGLDRKKFGKYVHKRKQEEGIPNNDHSWPRLWGYGLDYLDGGGRTTKILDDGGNEIPFWFLLSPGGSGGSLSSPSLKSPGLFGGRLVFP